MSVLSYILYTSECSRNLECKTIYHRQHFNMSDVICLGGGLIHLTPVPASSYRGSGTARSPSALGSMIRKGHLLSCRKVPSRLIYITYSSKTDVPAAFLHILKRKLPRGLHGQGLREPAVEGIRLDVDLPKTVELWYSCPKDHNQRHR